MIERRLKLGIMRSLVTFSMVILLAALPALLLAQDMEFLPDEPIGHMNDFAKLIDQNRQEMLENKLRNYRDTTTNVIAIATLPDLNDFPIEEVATKLFNDWKMWHEDRYNGILIVIAPNEREMRIEVGYGLEGAVPDVVAGRIIREVLAPSFKQGDFYEGLDRATTIMIDLAEGEYEGNLTRERSSRSEDDIASLIVFFLFIAFVIYVSSRRGGGKNGRRRRTLGSGGFIWLGGGSGSSGGFSSGGGSFGGFSGGGSFGSGGGGASGGW